MQLFFKILFGYIDVWSAVVVILVGLISRKTRRFAGAEAVWARMLTVYMFFVVGLMGLENAVMHMFLGDFAAKSIGWLPSPFQYEVGVANLVFAVLGFWAVVNKQFQFRKAVIIGFAIWFWGDAAGHIYQMLAKHDYAAYNAGVLLYTDILLPVLGIIILRCSKRYRFID